MNSERLIKAWQKRNIAGFYCVDKEQAKNKILNLLPQTASVGISGSVTLDQLEIVPSLELRGNKVFSPYKPNISREENLEIRRRGAQADYYLASANAISQNGELVFFSGYGNRIAGITYAKNVIIVCGINKIVPTLQEALKRSREYATPLNCKRLNWQSACFGDGVCKEEICLFPEYKRMCCQVLIIEAEVALGRLQVVLVGEELGF
jgi:hypothetical protein